MQEILREVSICSQEERIMNVRFSIAFVVMTPGIMAWMPTTCNPQDGGKPTHCKVDESTTACRRAFLATFASASFAIASKAVAVEKPGEFVNLATQAPPPDGNSPFVSLSNGVKVKDFRVGSGDGAVTSSSKVDIQCSGRLLNLNGVVFYNTKNNNPDGFGAIPLSISLGQGQAIPGLEAGLIGMKKGGIRRIIVPQELAYNSYPDLEPRPINANDKRALDSVVNNPRRDGAILFDVQIERFK